MPAWFTFSLKRAMLNPANDMTSAVLYNFRSFARFADVQWAARSLPELLFVLALLMGAGALAGEREAHTLPLVSNLGVRMRTLVLVKFGAYAAVIGVAAFSATVVILVHAWLNHLPVGGSMLLLATAVGFLNVLAFLAVVMLGSALASRPVYAGIYGLLIGFALLALFVPFGLNAMELPANLFAVDGSLVAANLARDVVCAFTILSICLGASVLAAEQRGAI
jgi:ABC-type transport system involved in multi-copper enzyme maturation permease subunit